MSFYCRNLESIILNKVNETVEVPDRMMIISGYVGPAPIKNLKSLNIPVKVVAGMYSKGVNSRLYNSLERCKKDNPLLQVYYSNTEIHSKIYIWYKDNQIIDVLIGSANFSNNGLQIPYRESLADMDARDNSKLTTYVDMILQNSTEHPTIVNHERESSYKVVHVDNKQDVDITENSNDSSFAIAFPLYVSKKSKGIREVAEKSGLNWGLSKGHTSEGDAYIKIPIEVERNYPKFFNECDLDYMKTHKTDRKKIRYSEPVEFIWDDGTVMNISLEGTQDVNGVLYPKQLSSYSSLSHSELGYSAKSILGRYLRKRMGLSVNHLITYQDLLDYGRTNVAISKISDGVYSADFSVKNK